ncbi:MAG TPA: hypothetical protein VGY13_06365 [Solirubrobacteraceae bacterium]|jgi:hypothetical protein|nr:hypothetical protein [Solirubrobacteraceae bacterium]
MTAPRSTSLALALACAALLAGCGSGGSNTTGTTGSTASTQGSTSTASSTSTSAPTTSSAPNSTTSTQPTTPALGASAAAQYASVCKAIIKSAPSLSATVKGKVEGICAKAAKGDEAGARAAAKEVCVEVIDASPIPTAAKRRALAECKAT